MIRVLFNYSGAVVFADTIILGTRPTSSGGDLPGMSLWLGMQRDYNQALQTLTLILFFR
jgi:hypothetical protein